MKFSNKIIIFLFICLNFLSCQAKNGSGSVIEIETHKDDTKEIINVIERELPTGVISVEQASGKLVHNPVLAEIKSKPNKKQFYLPAMIVNNTNGIQLVQNAPLTCFIITSNELLDEGYKNFRQHEVLRYIREVKDYSPEKVMICEVTDLVRNEWKQHIKLNNIKGHFVFEDYISLNGEHFYYYLNDNGNFEMYF